MIPSAIITAMRRRAKVNTTQYSDADALIDLNVRKNELWSAVCTTISEPYNWEQWTVTSVDLQSEYVIPEVTTTTVGAKLLHSVSIAYDTSTYTDTGAIVYAKARRVDTSSLPEEWNFYVENQSVTDPIYRLADNSIFIAPAPRTGEGGATRIKLTGIRNISNWSASTTEANMKFPPDHQQALIYALTVDGLVNKGADDGSVNNAEARWARIKNETVNSLENRLESSTFFLYPTQEHINTVTLD